MLMTSLGCSGPGPRSVESKIVSSAISDAATPLAERANSNISGAPLASVQAVPSPSTQVSSNSTPSTPTNLSTATAQPTIEVTPQSTATPQPTSTPTSPPPTATVPPIDTPTPHP